MCNGATGSCREVARRQKEAEIGRDIANLKAAMEAEGVEEGFLPVVAPASCFPNLIDEHYGSEQAALTAVAKAMGEEYVILQVNAGTILFENANPRSRRSPRARASPHATSG